VEKQGAQGCLIHDADERAASQSIHQASIDVVAIFDCCETDDEWAECCNESDIPAEEFSICHEKWTDEIGADRKDSKDNLNSADETYDSEFTGLVDESNECKHSVEIAQPHRNGEGLWVHAVEPFTFVEILEGVVEHRNSFTG